MFLKQATPIWNRGWNVVEEKPISDFKISALNANIQMKGKERLVKSIKWPVYLEYQFSEVLLSTLGCKPFLYLNRSAGAFTSVALHKRAKHCKTCVTWVPHASLLFQNPFQENSFHKSKQDTSPGRQKGTRQRPVEIESSEARAGEALPGQWQGGEGGGAVLSLLKAEWF